MEEEEEEEECFYESFDRILSSTSASSAAVSDADDDDNDSNFANNLPIPKFPKSVSNYDIWVSEPLPIEERRKRLLHEMGLSNDPLLSRRDGGFSRSVSSDHLKGKSGEEESNCFVARSRSDGAVVATAATTSNSSALCSSSSSVHWNVDTDLSKPHGNRSSGFSIGNVSVTNKPPTGKISKRVEEIRPNSIVVNPNNLNFLPVVDNLSGGVLDNSTDCNGVTEDLYKIKNLDDGKEFVIHGFRKDGKWNKVREIGSGQQLTIEEFERRVGHSPIVQELMRRQGVEGVDGKKDGLESNGNGEGGGGLKLKKKGSWLRSIKNVAGVMTGHKDRRSSDERDNSSEKGGRRSSSATDDSQDISFNFHEKVKVRQYGKSCKELTALYKDQEIQAHNGSIWSIKFSLDGQYLATAGEDCVIHVWQVMESERKGELLMEKPEDSHSNSCFVAGGSPEPTLVSSNVESHLEKKRRGRTSISRKSVSLDNVVVPDSVFALTEKPICSFQGHLDDVLDLSWSKTQHLLSSSMDKTVRLWHMASKSCLKVFSHSDYVTCIQFNPVDDRYFISGSLDAKVRIWSIPDRKVVDWSDLHEMVTAACYTPDGQSALVGSNKGSCFLYNTSENKLHQISQIDLQNKKKRSHLKKITGFQFAPGSSSEVLITSADSRIRVVNGVDLVHKFKGFRNTNSQITASLTANGKHVICASEDSHVYVWNHEGESQPRRNKGITSTQSYEHFHCRNVTAAIPWPGIGGTECKELSNHRDKVSAVKNSSSPAQESNEHEESPSLYGCTDGALRSTVSSLNNTYLLDRLFVTWPEEKLPMTRRTQSHHGSLDISDAVKQDTSAWGMVIVTANLKGEIKIFQNFGLPIRI